MLADEIGNVVRFNIVAQRLANVHYLPDFGFVCGKILKLWKTHSGYSLLHAEFSVLLGISCQASPMMLRQFIMLKWFFES